MLGGMATAGRPFRDSANRLIQGCLHVSIRAALTVFSERQGAVRHDENLQVPKLMRCASLGLVRDELGGQRKSPSKGAQSERREKGRVREKARP